MQEKGRRGQLNDQSAGLVVERSRVLVPARAAGKVSSPELTFFADSYSVLLPVGYS